MPSPLAAVFDPPWTTVHVGQIRGGTAHNITAEHCTFGLDFRVVPGEAAEDWARAYQAKVAEVEAGMKAVVVCVDGEALGGELAGREYDSDFLSSLPDGVDPCGENGEFHTFVYDGPIFRRRVGFRKGEVVKRDGRFYFRDLLPASEK